MPTLVKDINPGPASGYFNQLAECNGRVVFTADDGIHGPEPWISDGTAEGTFMLRDIYPGPHGSGRVTVPITRSGPYCFFVAEEPQTGFEIWRTDGTTAGTVLAGELVPGPASGYIGEFFGTDRYLYFVADDGTTGNELWRTDGTAAGTILLADINQSQPTRPWSASSDPLDFTVYGGEVFFSADDGKTGREVWKTDGTPSGTRMLKDFYPGISGTLYISIGVFNGSLYFSTDDGQSGSELWRSDGTVAGTSLFKDLWPGPLGSGPRDFTPIGSTMFFTAYDVQSGYRQLWKTDGTPAGTVVVRRVLKNFGLYPSQMTPMGNLLLFDGRKDGNLQNEVWRSDGTPEGTYEIRALLPPTYGGYGGSSPYSLMATGSRNAWYVATDLFHGRELYTTDGTAAGTHIVADLDPTPNNISGPGPLIMAGGKLFFSAYDGIHGIELFVLDVGASVQTVGRGCAGPGRQPCLTATDPVAGTTMEIRGSGAPTGTTALLLLGYPDPGVRIASSPCTLYLDPTRLVTASAFSVTTSRWRQQLAVPDAPDLLGVTFALQTVYAFTNGPIGADLTNAVMATAGR